MKHQEKRNEKSLKMFLGGFSNNLRSIGVLVLMFFACAIRVDASMIISEVAWMGSANGGTAQQNSNDEWIELANTGSETISLSGWSLQTADGGIMITLSGTVPGFGFFLLERTDDQSVPDVQADQLFTGSLANTNETLLLCQGNCSNPVFQVSANPDWPAGDNVTKETMQWTGSKWITAHPTPKAVNASSVSENTDTADTDTEEDETVKAHGPVTTSMKIHVKGELFTGFPLSFSSSVVRSDGAHIMSDEVRFNMGDGTTYLQKAGDVLSHMYVHPGTYVVTASYRRRTSFVDSSDAQSRMTIVIVDPVVRISSGTFGSVDITNNGSREVDLSLWRVVTDGRSFSIPSGTVILPRATVRLSPSVTGFDVKTPEELLLMFPNDTLADSKFKNGTTPSVSFYGGNESRTTPPATRTASVIDALIESPEVPVSLIPERVVPENGEESPFETRGIIILAAVGLACVSGVLAYTLSRPKETSIADSIEILE